MVTRHSSVQSAKQQGPLTNQGCVWRPTTLGGASGGAPTFQEVWDKLTQVDTLMWRDPLRALAATRGTGLEDGDPALQEAWR